jgi:hypothetical protein
LLETLFLSLNYEKSECINLKNCALGGSIILSTGGSIFVSAEVLLLLTWYRAPSNSILTGRDIQDSLSEKRLHF